MKTIVRPSGQIEVDGNVLEIAALIRELQARKTPNIVLPVAPAQTTLKTPQTHKSRKNLDDGFPSINQLAEAMNKDPELAALTWREIIKKISGKDVDSKDKITHYRLSMRVVRAKKKARMG